MLMNLIYKIKLIFALIQVQMPLQQSVFLLSIFLLTMAVNGIPANYKIKQLQAFRADREDLNSGRNWNREREAPPSNYALKDIYKKSNATQAPGKNKRFPKYLLSNDNGWKPVGAPVITTATRRPQVSRVTLQSVVNVTVKRKTKAKRGRAGRPKIKKSRNKKRKSYKMRLMYLTDMELQRGPIWMTTLRQLLLWV
jgi:hypothetical protein